MAISDTDQGTHITPTEPSTRPLASFSRPLRVYIASRGEDQAVSADIRAHLSLAGIESTARWIDQSLTSESHDEAEMDILDVRRADVLVLVKPASSHRHTTGGHHVETGVALGMGMPVVLLGERENVFHHHDTVTVVPFPVSESDFAAVARTIKALACHALGGRA